MQNRKQKTPTFPQCCSLTSVLSLVEGLFWKKKYDVLNNFSSSTVTEVTVTYYFTSLQVVKKKNTNIFVFCPAFNF